MKTKKNKKTKADIDWKERLTCPVCFKLTADQYMVTNQLWMAEAGLNSQQNAHLLCLEQLIGRRIRIDEFTDAPINDVIRYAYVLGTRNK